MRKNFLASIVLAALAGLSFAAHAAGESVPSRFAKVEIAPNGDDSKVVTVGKTKTSISDYSVYLHKTLQVGEREVHIFALSAGGNACPANFAFLVVEKGQVTETETFGNCHDEPKLTETGGRVVMQFPRVSKQAPAVTVELDGNKAFAGKKPLKTQTHII